jgi:hypothetical protein
VRAPPAAAALLLAVLSRPAAADEVCTATERQEADAAFARARAAEQAGRLDAALDDAARARSCTRSEADVKALVGRIGKRLGDGAERAGRLDDAFAAYSRTGLETDADRVRMRQARERPGDVRAVSTALQHFRSRRDEARLAELRELAAANSARALAEEEQAFAATRDSTEELGRARSWALLAAQDPGPVRERAERRGDALAREDGRDALEGALGYFRLADRRQKVEAVRARARALAEAALGRGEHALAADYLRLAGDGARAREVAKRGEEGRERSEKKRQKKFQRGAGDLEKELGL